MSKTTPHKGLMETITLLYMLDQVPESSRDNQQPQEHSILSSSYQLPSQREREIVEKLAFLSATTDDSTRVMAVCLEEAPDHNHCTIRLTSNTGDLDEVVYGFKLMARILERAASRVSSDNDDIKALFRCIVTLDYFHILSRLRSRHAKKTSRNKDKPGLLTLLNTSIHDQSIQFSQNVTISELQIVRTKVNALEALFRRFEDISEHSAASSEVQDVSMDLIMGMHDLASQMKFKLALESSSRLDPGLKSFLPEAVGKLGRYYSISYELVCVARNREYSIFNRIAIEACPIRRPSQPSNVDKNFHPLTALQNIVRSRNAVQSKASRLSLERCLGKPLQAIPADFRSIIADYYQSAKVHAEIQLLFFYELNLGRLRPRVICSSKSACYLCDLFFKLHGQFYVPRTHGRLYYKWTLPDWHILLPETRRRDFNILLKRFSDVLSVKITAALERGPARINHPNESCQIMPSHGSSSTITQSPEVLDSVIPNRPISLEFPVSSGSTNPEPHSFEPSPQSKLLTSAVTSSPPSTQVLHLPAQEIIIPRDLPPPDISTEPPTTSPQTTLNPPSATTPKPYHDLTQGEPTQRQISYPHLSINIGTTRVHLQLSCDTYPFPNPDMLSNNPISHCWVRVKWLQDTDAENIDPQAVNVEDLNYDTEMKFPHGAACIPTELHLRRGEDVVSIKHTV